MSEIEFHQGRIDEIQARGKEACWTAEEAARGSDPERRDVAILQLLPADRNEAAVILLRLAARMATIPSSVPPIPRRMVHTVLEIMYMSRGEADIVIGDISDLASAARSAADA